MLTKKSFAKINLYLRIVRKRLDGYHELETLIQQVNIFDTLEFELGGDGVLLACSDPALPVDKSNLVFRAADLFYGATGLNHAVRIHLCKNIPTAAGLGGGSSNAAVTLSALNELYGSPLNGLELRRLAADLGADVPFFLSKGPAICRGRGDMVETVKPLGQIQKSTLLLVKPAFGVPTAWAYRAWSRSEHCNPFPCKTIEEAVRAFQVVEPRESGDWYFNSLETPVFDKYPLLEIIKSRLRDAGAFVSGISGSGSTMFGLFREEDSAIQARGELKKCLGGSAYLATAGF